MHPINAANFIGAYFANFCMVAQQDQFLAVFHDHRLQLAEIEPWDRVTVFGVNRLGTNERLGKIITAEHIDRHLRRHAFVFRFQFAAGHDDLKLLIGYEASGDVHCGANDRDSAEVKPPAQHGCEFKGRRSAADINKIVVLDQLDSGLGNFFLTSLFFDVRSMKEP